MFYRISVWEGRNKYDYSMARPEEYLSNPYPTKGELDYALAQMLDDEKEKLARGRIFWYLIETHTLDFESKKVDQLCYFDCVPEAKRIILNAEAKAKPVNAALLKEMLMEQDEPEEEFHD